MVRGIGRRWRQSSGNACLSATQYAYHAIIFILPSALRGLTAPSGSWLCNSNRYENFEGTLHFSRFLALRSMRFTANSAEPKRIVSLLKYDWQHFLRGRDALFSVRAGLVILPFAVFDERSHQFWSPRRDANRGAYVQRSTLGLNFF